MDIIAGLITAVFLFIFFSVSEKIKIPKRFSTSLFSGFIVFVIFTKKVQLIGQKLVLVIVACLVIFALNLKVMKEEKTGPETSTDDESQDG